MPPKGCCYVTIFCRFHGYFYIGPKEEEEEEERKKTIEQYV
jgi:hypothetical protein